MLRALGGAGRTAADQRQSELVAARGVIGVVREQRPVVLDRLLQTASGGRDPGRSVERLRVPRLDFEDRPVVTPGGAELVAADGGFGQNPVRFDVARNRE